MSQLKDKASLNELNIKLRKGPPALLQAASHWFEDEWTGCHKKGLWAWAALLSLLVFVSWVSFTFLAAKFCFNPAADTWLDPAYLNVQGRPWTPRGMLTVCKGGLAHWKSFPGEREVIFLVNDTIRGAGEGGSEQVETSDRCDQRTRTGMKGEIVGNWEGWTRGGTVTDCFRCFGD